MFMIKFNPTALHIGYDFVLLVHFLGHPVVHCFTLQCFTNSVDVFKLIVSDRIQERHDSCYERQKITKESDKRYRSVNRKNKTSETGRDKSMTKI